MKQIGLFDGKAYDLPGYIEAQRIAVYDADEWEVYNGLHGTVITAPLPFTGTYEVLLDTGETRSFYHREIMKETLFR